jgi:hypothetical protein
MSLGTILLLALVAWMLFMHMRPGGHGGGGCCGGGHGGHPTPKDGSDGPS